MDLEFQCIVTGKWFVQLHCDGSLTFQINVLPASLFGLLFDLKMEAVC
jgi:hypothetical protein